MKKNLTKLLTILTCVLLLTITIMPTKTFAEDGEVVNEGEETNEVVEVNNEEEETTTLEETPQEEEGNEEEVVLSEEEEQDEEEELPQQELLEEEEQKQEELQEQEEEQEQQEEELEPVNNEGLLASQVAINGGAGYIELLGTDKNHSDFYDVVNKNVEYGVDDQDLPVAYMHRFKVNNAKTNVVNKIIIEVPEGMYITNYGNGDTAFKNQMQGNAVITRHRLVPAAIMDNNHILSDSLFNNTAKSVEWTAKTSSISYETENIIISAHQRTAFDTLSEPLKITYIEDFGGSNQKQYVLKINKATIGYEKTLDKTYNKTLTSDGDGVYDKHQSLHQASNKNKMQMGTWKFDLTLPSGVNAALTDSYMTGTAPNGTPRLTASEVFNFTKNGNRVIVESKMPVSAWGYNLTFCPIKFTLPSGANEVKIENVKFTSTNFQNVLIHSSTGTVTIKKGVTGEYVTVGFANSENALADLDIKNGARYDNSTIGYQYTTLNTGQNEFGAVGSFHMGNAGSTDSAPKTVVMNFDPTKVQVTAIPVNSKDNTIKTFKVSTVDANGTVVKNNQTITITKGKGHGHTDTNFAGKNDVHQTPDCYVTYKELGLSDDEYITRISYDNAIMEADMMWTGMYVHGKMLYEAPYYVNLATSVRPRNSIIGDVEAYTTNSPSTTTGKLEMHYFRSKGAGVWFTGWNTNTAVSAGKEFNLNLTYRIQNHYTSNDAYALYIKVPEGLDVIQVNTQQIKWVRSDQEAVRYDRNSILQGPFTSTGPSGTARYYRIDYSRIPQWDRTFGRMINENNELNPAAIANTIRFVSSPTFDGVIKLQDMYFLEYIGSTENFNSNSLTKGIEGNPYGFTQVKGSLVTLLNQSASLSVTSLTDVIAQSSAKNEEMTDYIVYNGKQSTILAVGTADTDKVNLKTTITNNSGVPSNDGSSTGKKTTIWVPIPKKGTKWGELSTGCKDTSGNPTDTMPFSLNLLDKVQNIDTNVWNIHYGINIVPPTDGNYGETWDITGVNNGKTWKTPAQLTTSDYKNVTCIRLTAKANIPAWKSGTTDVPYSMDLIASVAVDSADRTQKNSVDVIAPLVYRNLTTSDGRVFAGLAAGSPTAMTIARGKIKGQLFYDANQNGLFDSGDSLITGMSDGPYLIRVYGGANKALLKTLQVDSTGNYQINGLLSGTGYEDYYRIEVVNMDGQGRDFRKKYATTAPTANELVVSVKKNSDGKSTSNAYLYAGTTALTGDRAGIGQLFNPVPIETDSFDDLNVNVGGIYNIGVYAANIQTQYTFNNNTARGTIANPGQAASVTVVTNTTAKQVYKAAAGTALKLPTVTPKAGYTLKGWKVTGAADSTAKANPIGSTFGYENGSYDVVYNITSYKINYVLNGGTNATSNPNNYTVETNTITLANPTKAGYTFNGWTIKGATPSSVNITTPKVGAQIPKGTTGELTVTANWATTPITYTIAYDLDGGALPNGKTNPTSYTVETATFTLNNPTKNGYTFKGWTGTGLSAATITVKVEKGSTGNRSYKATWQINTYTITYALGGGTNNSANPANYTVAKLPITLKNPTRTGYTFKNWTITGATPAISAGSATIPANTTGNLTATANWLQNYTITYDLDGGALPNGKTNPTSYHAETAAFTLNNPTKNGHTFKGWTGTGLSAATVTVTVPKGSTGNRSYKATWQINTYTITYALGGGTNNSANPANYTVAQLPITLKNPTRTGYTFKNWTITGATPAITAGSAVIPANTTGNLTATANWLQNYTITYDLDGGALPNGKTNPTSYHAETAAFTLNNPTKNGHTFKGWTGTGLSAATVTVTVPKGSTGNRSYKATWQINTYTITYALGGGTNNSANPANYTVAKLPITLKNPTRRGYTFKSWTITGATPAITAGSAVIPANTTGNLTATANWTVISYKITYNMNDGTNNGSNPANYDVTSAAITLQDPTRSDFTFLGWTISGADPTSVNKSTPTKNPIIPTNTIGNLTVTAIWEGKERTITYNNIYDANNSANPTQYNASAETIINAITRSHYTFLGWTGSNGTTPQTTVKIPAGSTGPKSYTANWKAIDYTISYTLNSGTVSPANPTKYTIETETFTLTNPTRAGYTFKGWSGTGLTGDTNKEVKIEKGSTGARSYTANWTATNHTISYTLNGGTHSGNPTSYNITTADITLKDASRTGYTFNGWKISGAQGPNASSVNTTTPKKSPVIKQGTYGNLTCVADFSINTYTITYALGGGTNNSANPANYTVAKLPITLAAPTRAGYTFKSWTITGATPAITAGSAVIPANTTGNLTATASWTATNHTISYTLNGGTHSGNPTSYNIETANITLKDASKNGYTFNGWKISGAQGPNASQVNTTTPKKSPVILKGTYGNLTCVADFTANTYTITYVLNGATNGSGNPTSYTVEKLPITLKAASRTGYTFKSWTITGATPAIAAGSAVIPANTTGNLTATATLTRNNYTISYNLDGGALEEGKTNPTTYHVETAEFTLNNPSKKGHVFKGWTGTGLNEPTLTVKVTKGSTGNRSYVATYEAIGVESLTLNKKTLNITSGQNGKLIATVLPEDANNVELEWTSSDESVATVDNEGNIKTLKPGTVTITVKTTDGSNLEATCKVNVGGKVILVNIYNSSKGADIRFKPLAGAEKYTLMRKTDGIWAAVKTVKASEATKVGATQLQFIDESIKGNYGRGYIYSVSATIGNKTYDYDKTGLPLYRLRNPKLISIKSRTSTSVTVTWQAFPYSECHGYELQYSSDLGATWKKLPQVANPQVKQGDTMSQAVGGLALSTKYVFRVRCQKTNPDRGTGWSEYSPWGSYTNK